MAARRIGTEEIYGALLDDAVLAALPARLAQSFDARSVLIHWHYGDGTADVLSHSGYFSDAQLARYATDFAAVDPWARAAANPQLNGVAINLGALVPDAEFAKSPFYNEYIRPMGDDTFRCIGIRRSGPSGVGMIAVQRGRCQPGFEEEQVSRLAIMASDLEHLLMVRGRFSASSRQLKCLTAMLDLMPDPTMMVNRDGQVIHANAAAEDMLGREKALEVRHGKLATPSSREQHHLHRLIYEACGDGPTGGSLALPRDGWPPLILSVTPLLGQPARAALIVMRDPASEHRQLLAQLKSLFDLTAAEAEVAYSLAKGSTLAELAAIRDVSLGTLRNQLKSVFAKVGCSRQAELVLLVRSIPVTRQLTPGPTPQLALS